LTVCVRHSLSISCTIGSQLLKFRQPRAAMKWPREGRSRGAERAVLEPLRNVKKNRIFLCNSSTCTTSSGAHCTALTSAIFRHIINFTNAKKDALQPAGGRAVRPGPVRCDNKKIAAFPAPANPAPHAATHKEYARPRERLTKRRGQGASSKTVHWYGKTMQRSHQGNCQERRPGAGAAPPYQGCCESDRCSHTSLHT